MNIAILVLSVVSPLLIYWAKRLSDNNDYACYIAGFAGIVSSIVCAVLILWQSVAYLFMVCK